MNTIGFDEVGRGAWAGPVVVAAVQLRNPIMDLTDSKLVSAQKRRSLNDLIKRQALQIGIGWVDSTILDKISLQEAIRGAATIAFSSISYHDEPIIIDGKDNWLPQVKGSKTVVKADLLHQSVSAASVVAKVFRDDYMALLDIETNQQYGFTSNKGYGTKAHMVALSRIGVSNYHRLSFKPIQKMCD